MGLFGIQTTTAGNVVTSRSLSLNATPFDLVQLMIDATAGFGILFGSFALASIRTWSFEGKTVTRSMVILSLFASILLFSSYLAYGLAFRAVTSPLPSTMPPPLYLVQAARDLVFPILFFFALYFLGSRVDAFRGHSSLVALLIAGCAAATILGIAAQDLVSYGFYFASFFSYDLLLNVVFGGVYAAFLGFMGPGPTGSQHVHNVGTTIRAVS